jgi:hypothetical protein
MKNRKSFLYNFKLSIDNFYSNLDKFLQNRFFIIYFFNFIFLFFLIFVFLFFLFKIAFFFNPYFFFELNSFFNFFKFNNFHLKHLDFLLFFFNNFYFNNIVTPQGNTELISVLVFPYFDEGTHILFENRFPYGFLGYGHYDFNIITPFFDSFFLNNYFYYKDFSGLFDEYIYINIFDYYRPFYFKFLSYFNIQQIDFSDYSFVKKLRYYTFICNFDPDYFFFDAFLETSFVKFPVDYNDLRNNFF